MLSKFTKVAALPSVPEGRRSENPSPTPPNKEPAQPRSGLPQVLGSAKGVTGTLVAKKLGGSWKKRASSQDLLADGPGSTQRQTLQWHPRRSTFKAELGYAVDKHGVSKIVVNFSKPPDLHPYTLCFHFAPGVLTHHLVLRTVRSRIQFIQGDYDVEEKTSVASVQYVDRNVRHGTQGLDSRWIVKLSDGKAMEQLLATGICLYNRKVTLYRYDEVLAGEYQDYLAYMAKKERLFLGIHEDDDLGKVKVRRDAVCKVANVFKSRRHSNMGGTSEEDKGQGDVTSALEAYSKT